MSDLFQPVEPLPCLRLTFRLMLSWNDIKGEKWQVGEQKHLWRKRGNKRALDVLRGRDDVLIQAFAEYKTTKYGGVEKRALHTGERLFKPFFMEPVILIARLWKSDNTAFDIDNLMLKPIIDGIVDARVLINDTTDHLPTVVRHYEGIDKTAAMSAAEIHERDRLRQQWKDKGLKKVMPPPPNKKIYLDFWRKSVLLQQNPYFLLTQLTPT